MINNNETAYKEEEIPLLENFQKEKPAKKSQFFSRLIYQRGPYKGGRLTRS
jgi:hypothetical protein